MRRFTGNAPGLIVLCSVQFVVVLDATIVTTALPVIRSSLGFSDAGLTWVVTAYTLVLGALLVPAGRVADLLGPRRALVTGLGMFVAASVTCATAWNPAALVAARAVQGLGAALLAPAALALLGIVAARVDGSDRVDDSDRVDGPDRVDGAARVDGVARVDGSDRAGAGGGAVGGGAIGWWTAAGALGGGSGWVAGGLLTDHLGWPAIFWINLPIGLVAIAAALAVLPRGQRQPGQRVDLRGALVITAALGLLVYLSWASLVAAAALIALFVWHIRRDADPLIPPRLLRPPAVAGANLTAALLTASTTPAMYLAMLHLQQVRGLTPAHATVLFPVFNVGVVTGSLIGPRAVRRIGHRPTAGAGFVLIAGGAALLAMPPAFARAGGLTVTAAAATAVAFAMVGAGLGAASVASTKAGTDAAVPEHRGVGSGVLTASAQIGTALGLAVLTPLAAASASPAGYRVGFLGAAVVALLGVLAALLLPAAPRRPAGRERVGAGR